MVRAITVLATFRSSRSSCIGLLVNNIRIKYIDIDFRSKKQTIEQEEDIGLGDDSGSKLRDKEQQRLSSK